MMDEEIRQAVSEVREMKQMCGNINMKLTNIVTQRGQDWKKKLEAEYQRGLNDAWECARKIVCDDSCGGMSMKELVEIFNKSSDAYILRDFTAQQAIEMLKAYEKKLDDKIEVGDIIANNTEPKLKVWVTCFDEIGFCGIAITDFGTVDRGKIYSSCSPKGWHKIGHFDIASILEDMRHD